MNSTGEKKGCKSAGFRFIYRQLNATKQDLQYWFYETYELGKCHVIVKSSLYC